MDEVKQFLRFFIVDSFKPNKTEDYLAKYLHVCQSIQRIKPTRKYFYFEIFKFVLSFPSFYFIFLYFLHSEGRDIILNADIVGSSQFDRKLNFVIFSNICLMMYMFHMTYFSDEVQVVLLMIKSLLEDNPKQMFHWPYIYKNHLAMEFVKHKVLKYLNYWSFLYLGECKVFSFVLIPYQTNSSTL